MILSSKIAACLLGLLGASCAATPESNAFIRATTTVYDDIESNTLFGGLLGGVDIDYQAVDIAVGKMYMKNQKRVRGWELGASTTEYDRFDVVEYFLGTRQYFAGDDRWFPYFHASLAYTDFDEEDVGPGIDPQFSIRPALGTEIGLTDYMYLDFMVGYQFPIVPFEDLLGNEIKFSGFTGRAGMGFLF